MAILILATCNACGDVELSTGDLLVRRREDAASGTYVFRCPSCAVPVVRPADPPTIDLLVKSGCRLDVWSPPAELTDLRPRGAAFTHDDLIDFYAVLQQDDWFDDLLDHDRGP